MSTMYRWWLEPCSLTGRKVFLLRRRRHVCFSDDQLTTAPNITLNPYVEQIKLLVGLFQCLSVISHKIKEFLANQIQWNKQKQGKRRKWIVCTDKLVAYHDINDQNIFTPDQSWLRFLTPILVEDILIMGEFIYLASFSKSPLRIKQKSAPACRLCWSTSTRRKLHLLFDMMMRYTIMQRIFSVRFNRDLKWTWCW